MTVFPNAKINLGLHITAKRDDGYHNIESIFYPVGLKDTLELEYAGNSKGIQLLTTGLPVPGHPGDNLCVKAYDLISRDYPLPGLLLRLEKNIPVGAGLGGSSSDAAFFIRQMNVFLELGLAWGEMHHYAKQLGSDCSFFISNRPAMVTGRGDQMESLVFSLNGYYLKIVCPAVHISTAEAYRNVKPAHPVRDLETLVTTTSPGEWKDKLVNDFEKSIFKVYPILTDLKNKLYESGALYASMTGSGSAVYGIFEKPVSLAGAFGDAFVWEGEM